VKFEKVRKEFFANDSFKNGFENAEEAYEKIVLPVRKTEGSAAYDFSLCYDLDLYGGERRIVPTGIKAIMDKGEVLLLTVRSSVGIKDGVLFSNGLAVIDSDFANNESDDGDIKLALWNTTGKLVRYKAGDRIAQGMFFKFDITEDDNASGVRIGGVCSTGKE
jgi:dUTP pyrophosphatase